MKRRLLEVTCLALALGIGAASGAGADPVKIRAPWVATPASLIPILFAKDGIAKHNGVSYDFQPIFFSASPTEITALAAGEIEIGTINFSSFPIAVENAGLTDLKIIADETQDGVDGYTSVQYMVLNDSPVKTVEDLKGKIVAVNGIGAGVELGMRYFLKHHGLQFQHDYSNVEVPFPNMKAVLMEHKADLIEFGPPFMYDPQIVSGARTLFTLKDALNGTELSFWVMRQAFLDKNRAAVVDLLEDMVRSYRWYSDPANHAEAVAILAKFIKQTPAQADWAFTKRDFYRDPNGQPNLTMLQSNVDAVHDVGFIKTGLDIAKYADLSLVKEAASRIK